MKIPVKISKSIKKEAGDIIKLPTFTKKREKTKTKFVVFFILGCIVGFALTFGLTTFNKKTDIEKIIFNDFASSYILGIEKSVNGSVSINDIEKIKYTMEQIKKVFENSGVDINTLNNSFGKNAHWFFQGGETLVFMSRETKEGNIIKILLYDIEREVKKDFNISSSIYRNYEITQLIPTKNSIFTKSIFYTIDIEWGILISDNITFIRNAIDKVLER